jgi:ABC-type cobalamin/Fe3+-siderophores transport system ATPase subunit
MSELENRITKITIPNENAAFFTGKNFTWDSIPKFAVITGINGSGKTQLLKKIHEIINNPSAGEITYKDKDEKYQANEVYYKEAHGRPLVTDNVVQINQLDVEKQSKMDQIKSLIAKINTNAKRNGSSVSEITKVIRSHNDRYEAYYSNRNIAYLCPKSEYDTIKKVVDFITDGGVSYLVDGSGEYLVDGTGAFLAQILDEADVIKRFVNITEDELTKYINSLVTDQSNIANIQIFNVFLNYHDQKGLLKIKAFNEIDCNKMTQDEARSFISSELQKKFNTDQAPWDVINQLLKKYKFNHRVSVPDESSTSSYNPSFTPSGIKFNSLSSGEEVIFHLICSSYGGNGGVGGKTKLLLLDEFDAHLNPTMSKMFVEIVRDTLVKEFGMQVIMTTHSPSTAAYVPEENLFWMEEGKILQGQDKKEKMWIIHKLATGFVSEDSTCPFMSYLVDPTKPYYIIVEGYTDILHIKTACKKLGDEYEKLIFNKCNFINLGGTKEVYAKSFISNFGHGKKMIAIFDNDKSGAELFDKIFTKSYGQDKGIKRYEENSDVIGIILKPSDDVGYKESYGDQINFGYIPIELLYSKNVVDTFNANNNNTFLSTYKDTRADKYTEHYRNQHHKTITTDTVNRLFFIGQGELKVKFANAAKGFDKEYFNGFKTTLDLVLKVIKKWEEDSKLK